MASQSIPEPLSPTGHDSGCRLDMNINGTVVSVIVEREHNGEVEGLVQTRWKPERDPVYSGTLEIPAGGIGSYENVYKAARREKGTLPVVGRIWQRKNTSSITSNIGLRITMNE